MLRRAGAVKSKEVSFGQGEEGGGKPRPYGFFVLAREGAFLPGLFTAPARFAALFFDSIIPQFRSVPPVNISAEEA